MASLFHLLRKFCVLLTFVVAVVYLSYHLARSSYKFWQGILLSSILNHVPPFPYSHIDEPGATGLLKVCNSHSRNLYNHKQFNKIL